MKDINGITLLFLNNLKRVEISIDGKTENYELQKIEKHAEETDNIHYNNFQAKISEENHKTEWFIINGVYPIPIQIKEQLHWTWKDTDCIKISFALMVNKEKKFEPIKERSFLNVFFPTEEKTPFLMLVHGTFRTNVDRRLLVPEDLLNDFAIEKTVALFRDKVLQIISDNIDDPGKILDFIRTP